MTTLIEFTRLFAKTKFLAKHRAGDRAGSSGSPILLKPHSLTNSLMKYTLLAIAVALLAVSCKSSQPAPSAPPPMVDMGVRSGK